MTIRVHYVHRLITIMAQVSENIEVFSSKLYDFDDGGFHPSDTRNIESYFGITSKSLDNESNPPSHENSDSEEENDSLENLKKKNIDHVTSKSLENRSSPPSHENSDSEEENDSLEHLREKNIENVTSKSLEYESNPPSHENSDSDGENDSLENLTKKNIENINSKSVDNESNPPSRENSDSEEENDGLENLRKKNIEKMSAIINSLRNQELEKQFRRDIYSNQSEIKETKKVQNKKNSSLGSKIDIAVETRKSSRLRNVLPNFFEDDEERSVRSFYSRRPNYSIEDYMTKDIKRASRSFRKSGFRRKEEERVILSVEEVTEDMLNNIAVRVKDKVYSQSGTTCHQCRQKTKDQKTCCRNSMCVGIQGTFCGVCIRNRYGENCADALLNPNWICPVCRGKCNCSICRSKQGKRPTGILAPVAFNLGYESVDHFLAEIKGEGDVPEEDRKWALMRDPEAVLGFSDDGRKVHLQNGETHLTFCSSCSITDCDNSENLLGFSNDGKYAVMGGRIEEPLFFVKF